MSWPESDELLVELARTDRQAFGELYERHVKRVYNYIYYRVSRQQDAEDLTARTFTQALAHLPRYRQQGVPLYAWLLRIAHNLVANWYRDNKRLLVPLEDAGDLGSRDGNPETEAEAGEERRTLLAAVAQLPADRQQLILLRFSEGLKAAEIAVIMGRSEGAVKALLHRTLEGLRKNLSERRPAAGKARTFPFGGR
ncbi:MAG: sigma-70 family RNA polymerase sigma factor [Chloroflexi bacterium]|nr:sigma-70 family RNA polymerase sigma factor [Chloroflexota bacterium]MCL5107962.1 sigma-70 family RNA polymerase sigma factor [Chloroflexota bacterium]